MNLVKRAFLALSILVGAAAFAETNLESNDEVCFNADFIRGFEVEDRRNVIVEARRNERYLVNVFSCFELPWANAIAFSSGPAGSRRICRGDNLLVVDPYYPHRVIDRCAIRSITRAE